MENKDKPAHPLTVVHEHYTNGNPARSDVYTGLTKRELIAAMAMQGVLSGYWGDQSMTGIQRNFIANEAVNYADALLKALK